MSLFCFFFYRIRLPSHLIFYAFLFFFHFLVTFFLPDFTGCGVSVGTFFFFCLSNMFFRCCFPVFPVLVVFLLSLPLSFFFSFVASTEFHFAVFLGICVFLPEVWIHLDFPRPGVFIRYPHGAFPPRGDQSTGGGKRIA